METGASNRSARESDPDRIPSPESWSFESSRILPQVFEGLDTARKLSVLDAGPVESLTVDFLRRFRCQFYVANLFDRSCPQRGVEAFSEFLDSHGDVRFDICLLWDYANYPDDPALAEFVSALGNHVHENSRIHAIGAYSTEVPLRAHRYAIASVHRLAMRPVAERAPHARSQNNVVKAMPRFFIHQAALRRDNRLELLLRPGSIPSQ